jgi:hypothetical protein
LYLDATRGHLQAYRKWLIPVYGTQQWPRSEVLLAETSVA